MTPFASSTSLLIGAAFGVMLILSGLGLSFALRFPRARPQLDWLELGFVVFMLSTGLALSLGLVLAWFRVFSLGALTLLLSVIALVSWGVVWRRGTFRSLRRELVRPRRAEVALLGLLAVLSVIYFRPHEFILGAADAGVYVNMGSHIARSGELLIDDPLIAQLDPSFYPVFFREQLPNTLTRYYYLPGYYLSDTVPGQIIPQFYALQAISIAILTAIGGVPLGLMATPIWGLMGIVAVYLLARNLFDRHVALLAAVLLGTVILQNWFARYPTAEVLTQSFLFAGLYALGRLVQRHEPLRSWGFAAGLWLGLIFLIRIDMILVLAVLPVLLIGLAAARRWSPGLTVLMATLGVLTVQGIVHAVWFAWPYTYNTYQAAVSILLGRNGWLWVVVGMAAGIIGIALLFFGVRWFNRLAKSRRNQLRQWVSRVLIVAVCGAAFYAYFLRPVWEPAANANYWYGAIEIPVTNRENLVRIGWYVTPLGLALVVLGLCIMIWRERSLPVWVFGAIGLLSTVVYVYNILNNPHHIYAMRRYVPVVIPAMMIWGAYGLAYLSRARRRSIRLVTWIVLLAWLAGMVWQSRVIWRQVDDAGAVTALTEFNRRLEPGAIVLFDDQSPVGWGDVFGTPLRFIYEHPVFVLRNPQAVTPKALRALVRDWQQRGYPVYVMSQADKTVSVADSLPLSDAQQYLFETTVLQPTYTDYPNKVVPMRYDVAIREVQALR
jgi:4-amino-4-deoxy-L-arabinose transferase-like glycosyltransferase